MRIWPSYIEITWEFPAPTQEIQWFQVRPVHLFFFLNKHTRSLEESLEMERMDAKWLQILIVCRAAGILISSVPQITLHSEPGLEKASSGLPPSTGNVFRLSWDWNPSSKG